VLDEFMLEARATKGRDMRLKIFVRELLEIELGMRRG
jgi:hypothetical protein